MEQNKDSVENCQQDVPYVLKNRQKTYQIYLWYMTGNEKKMSIRSAVSSPHHNRHNVGIVDQRNAFHSSTFLNGIVRPITSIID